MGDIHPFGEIYMVANDLKQADSRMAKYARHAIRLSPTLQEKFRTRGYHILHLTNNSSIEAIPIDPEGEAGANPDAVMFSELWGAMEEAKSRMWSESTLSPTKFGKSFRWVESYAGYEEESEILFELWEKGTQDGELIWPNREYPVTGGPGGEIVGYEPLEVYKNEAARLFCLWNTKPRCPWQTAEYYAQEEAMLLPTEFLRMHRNQWVSNIVTFVPIEWWDACKRDPLPEIPHNHALIAVMDAAVSDDTFGMMLVGRHPDKIKYPNDAVIWYPRCWKPEFGKKLDYTEPENLLREWIAKYNVVEVAYDEYQLHDMANRLKKEGLAFFRQFPQGSGKHSRLVADSAFRDMIRERRIWHDGDLDLRKHILHASAKVDKEDRQLRIVKRVQKLKIDLAVCGSMGSYECFRLNL